MGAEPRTRDYRHLNAGFVQDTVVRLQQRIAARFPDRSLVYVAQELGDVVREASAESGVGLRRERSLRLGARLVAAAIVLVMLVTLSLAVQAAFETPDAVPAFQWLSVLESAINDVVFAGIAVYFLLSVPSRLRRRRTLAVLHRLRSLAHVIDMHQLTKDPERLISSAPATEASMESDLDAAGLGRYLDYCSEMLSLLAKAAALCAEQSDDAVVLDTVSEIETLTNGMARKIWQKISLLHPST